jgi:energy-coupling factor transport system permease protein
VIYRRRASPLHAARAAAGAAYCAVLAACALAFEHPLILAAVAIAALGAAAGAGVLDEVGRTARFTMPFALVVAVINTFVAREGLTVFARLGELGPLGQVDLTVEALVYGLILGARVVVVVLCCALFSAAVDPDEVLRLFRRVSFRSALTAALATRLMPVLARDARRMADARACRPHPGSRVAVLRAVTTSALDRAIDVAATLEVRGYGAAGAARPVRAPWSRHDLAFAASALVLVALGVAAALGGWASVHDSPRFSAPVTPTTALAAAALLACALAPFADRRGIG